jgi:hypothetical protein
MAAIFLPFDEFFNDNRLKFSDMNVTLLTCSFVDYHYFSAVVAAALLLLVVLAIDVESMDEFEVANLNELSPMRESL